MAGCDRTALSEGERRFLEALNELGVRYLLVGMSAALVQGARGSTDGLDLWFERLTDSRIGDAARRCGGVWVNRVQPPLLGGGELGERWAVVTHMDGLLDFSAEYALAKTYEVDGVPVTVLPLDRILASKRAANRPKDQATTYLLESTLAIVKELDAERELASAIELIEITSACPEQYDARLDGRCIGYLRLRRGEFSVQCPDEDGEVVFEARPRGDGRFEDDERDEYLSRAKTAIARWSRLRPVTNEPTESARRSLLATSGDELDEQGRKELHAAIEAGERELDLACAVAEDELGARLHAIP